MSRLRAIDTPLACLKVIERSPSADSRGFLMRLFCAEDLASTGWHKSIAQINHTGTKKRGTVRGLHYQKPPHTEMKLVTCLRGALFDVALDLRAGSATFLQWFSQELSAGDGRSLLIPEGFAHGFQTLTDDCEMLYLHSAAYAPAAESGIHPEDPRVAIHWPLPVSERSQRDSEQPFLDADYEGVCLS